jgi:DNA-directed RNA polymerase subunit RPC12/RpoP
MVIRHRYNKIVISKKGNGLFFKSNIEKAKERKLEEYFFDIVARELNNNIKHDAVWAKAIAKSQGDIGKAESYYIKYRIESLKDDMILNQEAYEEKLKKDGIYICSNCHAEVKPKKKSKGCLLILIPLLFLYIVPGVIYALFYSGYIYKCPKCDHNINID